MEDYSGIFFFYFFISLKDQGDWMTKYKALRDTLDAWLNLHLEDGAEKELPTGDWTQDRGTRTEMPKQLGNSYILEITSKCFGFYGVLQKNIRIAK